MTESSLRGATWVFARLQWGGHAEPPRAEDTAQGDSALAGFRPGRFWWDLLGGERDWESWKWGGRLPPPPKPGEVAAAGRPVRSQALSTWEVSTQDTCTEPRRLRRMSAT